MVEYVGAVDLKTIDLKTIDVKAADVKKPRNRRGFFEGEAWRCPTLTWGDPTLPSALLRFTSEFGMDSGGATMLLPPSKI